MKNRIRSQAVAFAVASSLSVFASGCSDAAQPDDHGSDWSGPVGSLGLQLQLAPDIVLSSIEYEITGQGFSPMTGSIQVPGGGTTFSATLTEIPAGSGHVIKLRSVAAGDAGLACAGQATFSVTANTTTQVDVVLSCDGLDVGGSATINGSFNICPSVTATTLSPTVQAIGGTIAVSLSARDVDMAPQPLLYAWTTNSGTLTNANTTAPTLLCTQPGPVALTYTVRDGACVKSGTLNATCGSGVFDGGVPTDGGADGGRADAGGDASTDAGPVSGNPANIVINEVESNGGTPGDWVELYNKGAQAVDVSGWLVRDNDDTHTVTIPASTVLQPGGFFVVDTDPTYGLGGGDSARLYTPGAATLIDSYSWTAHAAGTYGRCPNGLGAFVDAASTRGAANTCAVTVDAGTADAGSELAWPGSNTVTEVDPANTWTSNLSGLAYQAGSPNVLWAVQNGPSKIYKLVASGSQWVHSADAWSAGKTIAYPGAIGAPDSEGIAVGLNGALYVSTERDNNANGVSKLSVLQFVDAPGTTLVAQREWNLTADLPAVGANLGLEAIAFIPDAELAAQSFKEDSGSAYNQARYAQNGGGVFAVGLEGGGGIYLYALDHAGGAFTKLATLPSGFGGVMDLAYDPDTNYLWAWADDTYGNRAAVFEIEPSMVSSSYGKFVLRKVLARPTGLPNSNNEGFTFAPDAQCTGGFRAVFWADDSNVNTHALRQGSLTCGKSY
jgi:hypothetical protein